MRRQRHGFWESYPDRVAEESLLRAQLVQALLQADIGKIACMQRDRHR
jgi:hypothetical protein